MPAAFGRSERGSSRVSSVVSRQSSVGGAALPRHAPKIAIANCLSIDRVLVKLPSVLVHQRKPHAITMHEQQETCAIIASATAGWRDCAMASMGPRHAVRIEV